MRESFSRQAVKGVMWSAVERFSVQGIQFALSIVIARLVLPSEYGLIAMLGIFLAIAQAFVDSGFLKRLDPEEGPDGGGLFHGVLFQYPYRLGCLWGIVC